MTGSPTGLIPMDVPIVLSREEARRLAAEELRKAKYNGLPDWVVDGLRRLNDVMQQLLDFFDRRNPGTGEFNPVVIVVVLLLVATVVFIVWRVGLPRLRHRAAAEEVSVDSARTPMSYREQAARLAAAGDFRGAIGDRFRAVVRDLEERTVLDVRPARTASEVAHSAAVMLPDSRADLDELALIFNDAWYGERPPDAESYATVSRLDDAIVAAADRADLAGPDPGAAGGLGPGGTMGTGARIGASR